MAAVYGYDTWADYVTEEKMVGSGRKVDEVSDISISISYAALW